MNSDLVHPTSEGPAEDHAGGPVEAHSLELRPALLAVARDLAHPDLVADHLHRLGALGDALRELSLHPAHVLLQHLSVPDLLLHLPRLPRVPPEHEEARGEPVQPVDGPEVLEIVFLGENEDHGVMAVSPTGMYLSSPIVGRIIENLKAQTYGKGARLVQHHQLLRQMNDFYWFGENRSLVPDKCIVRFGSESGLTQVGWLCRQKWLLCPIIT